MHEVRGDLRQGLKDETSLVKTGVGNSQVIFGDRDIAVEKYIEIDGARPPAERSHPAENLRLDPLKLSQKLPGRERGFHLQGGVQESGLRCPSDCFRVVKAGEGGDTQARNLADLGYPPQEVQFPVPHAGTECYENLIVHRLIRT